MAVKSVLNQGPGEAEFIKTGSVLATVLDTMSEGFALYDGSDRLVTCNEQYRSLYSNIGNLIVPGIRFSQLARAVVDWEPVTEVTGDSQETLSARKLATWRDGSQLEWKTSDGRWVHLRNYLVEGGGRVVIGTDVTERKRAEQLFGSLLESAPDSMVIVSEQGKIVMVNAQTEKIFGYAREEMIGQPLEMLVPERLRRRHRKHRREYSRAPHLRPMGSGLELFGVRSDGSEFPADISLSYVENDEGMLVSCAIRDVTERRRADDELFEEKERLRATLLSIGDAVITTDANGVIEYLNPVAEKHTGWSLALAQGQRLDKVFHIIHEQSRERVKSPVAQCLEQGGVVQLASHTVLITRDGREVSVQDTAASIRSRDGNVLGVVLVFSDVTQTRRLEQQLLYQATHDALTGLVCRKEFERRLERVLDDMGSNDEHALCYLDLDQFKVINDTCGHMAGDELLRQVGSLLAKRVRRRDTLARLGGDEFGILLEHCTLAQARRIANAARRDVAEYRFVWEGKSFSIGASIGLVPVNAASGNIGDVLSAADSACYTAKDRGRNRIQVYHENDTDLARRHTEMQWVGRINEALEDDRFQLCLQPIVPARGRQRAGEHYEILLRMRDEEGQMVMPTVFLPAAERYGLSTKIDEWVVRNTFEWLQQHPADLDRLYVCEINLSGRSLGDSEFLESILGHFEDTSIAPDKICFEITETAAIANLDAATRFMGALKRLGCYFALDDFGSGISSFGYLRTLPVDFLKIDGLFVKGVVADPISAAMVKSINEIGQAMGMKTIAEFVETRAILDKVHEIGVDYVQGYAVGRPRPMA